MHGWMTLVYPSTFSGCLFDHPPSSSILYLLIVVWVVLDCRDSATDLAPKHKK